MRVLLPTLPKSVPVIRFLQKILYDKWFWTFKSECWKGIMLSYIWTVLQICTDFLNSQVKSLDAKVSVKMLAYTDDYGEVVGRRTPRLRRSYECTEGVGCKEEMGWLLSAWVFGEWRFFVGVVWMALENAKVRWRTESSLPALLVLWGSG